MLCLYLQQQQWGWKMYFGFRFRRQLSLFFATCVYEYVSGCVFKLRTKLEKRFRKLRKEFKNLWLRGPILNSKYVSLNSCEEGFAAYLGTYLTILLHLIIKFAKQNFCYSLLQYKFVRGRFVGNSHKRNVIFRSAKYVNYVKQSFVALTPVQLFLLKQNCFVQGKSEEKHFESFSSKFCQKVIGSKCSRLNERIEMSFKFVLRMLQIDVTYLCSTPLLKTTIIVLLSWILHIF